MDLGRLLACFRELREDNRFSGAVREAVEWLGIFLIMVVLLWILK
jgi:hypothetical protein